MASFKEKTKNVAYNVLKYLTPAGCFAAGIGGEFGAIAGLKYLGYELQILGYFMGIPVPDPLTGTVATGITVTAAAAAEKAYRYFDRKLKGNGYEDEPSPLSELLSLAYLVPRAIAEIAADTVREKIKKK